MTWPFCRRQLLEEAIARAAALDRELYHAQRSVVAFEAQLQATERRELYWRTRAEKFIDQIALRSGNISEPTMREAPPPPRDAAASVFGALATTEINKAKDRLTVSSVDGALAASAVAEALA